MFEASLSSQEEQSNAGDGPAHPDDTDAAVETDQSEGEASLNIRSTCALELLTFMTQIRPSPPEAESSTERP